MFSLIYFLPSPLFFNRFLYELSSGLWPSCHGMIDAIITVSMLLLGRHLLVARSLQNGKMGGARQRRPQLALSKTGMEGSQILLERKQAVSASCCSWYMRRGEMVFVPLCRSAKASGRCPVGKWFEAGRGLGLGVGKDCHGICFQHRLCA